MPTLKEELDRKETTKTLSLRERKQKERERRRTTYFFIGHSNRWKIPIHKTIQRIKNKCGLTWRRVSMSCHRFTNLGEIFQGDLSRKLTLGIGSQNWQTLPCNCRTKRTKGCDYNNICRNKLVVYEVTCLNTGKVYIGNTHRHFKIRMQEHFGDTKNLHEGHGKRSDSYARHFASRAE